MYLQQLRTGQVMLVSVGSDGRAAGALDTYGNSAVNASNDGAYALFVSRGDVLPGVPPGIPHLYRTDMSSGSVRLVDRTATGQPSQGLSGVGGISRHGEVVAFTTSDSLTAPDDNDETDAYLWTMGEGVSLISAESDGSARGKVAGVRVSANGRFAAYTRLDVLPCTCFNLYRRNLNSGSELNISDNSRSKQVALDNFAISVDGQVLAWETTEDHHPQDDGGRDIYARSVETPDYKWLTRPLHDPPATRLNHVGGVTASPYKVALGTNIVLASGGATGDGRLSAYLVTFENLNKQMLAPTDEVPGKDHAGLSVSVNDQADRYLLDIGRDLYIARR